MTGIRFAFEPGAGRNAVPVRSAIVGAVLAMVVVTSTLTFGTSLRTLVSHPALYGWNWNYDAVRGVLRRRGPAPKQVTTLLDHDPYVSAWAGIYLAGAAIDGKDVPVLAASPNAPVAPPLLSGHGLERPDQIVLGASTLAELHKHVGDTVKVQTGPKRPTTLHIVGTATMPAIGKGMTMGTGALLSYQLIPPKQRNQQQSAIPGPNAILIRVHKTANPTAALRSLQQINDTINKGPDEAGGVVDVLRPAEIVNYRSMGTTPALLGATLAVGAIAALTLTLIASVRRRRRELALLKTLGFTRRQLAAVVAWQSTIAVGIGVVIGVPARHHHRPVALGPLRPRDPRRTPTDRPRTHDHAHRRRRARPRQPRRRNTRTPSRAHPLLALRGTESRVRPRQARQQTPPRFPHSSLPTNPVPRHRRARHPRASLPPGTARAARPRTPARVDPLQTTRS